MDINELYDLINPLHLDYTCYYLLCKKEQKNQYHFGFFIDPVSLIKDVYNEIGIETEFVREITPKKHTKQTKDALKVISFNVWYAKKFSIPIETHKTSYKEYPVHFLTLTDKQVENINIEYDAYIEQLSISDKNPKPIVKQATLF